MATALSKYISVSDAAKRMGVSRQYLYRLIRDGRIKSREIAGKKVIHIGQLPR